MSLDLDHVAIGAAQAAEVARRLTADLGGTLLGGGAPPGSGFRSLQVHLGTPQQPGMTVEVLEPWQPEHNDFLTRFLARHGDGPHHITYKTDDIAREHARLVEAGYQPVSVDFSRPQWREMFLHPKDAHGVVIQIAQPGSKMPPIAELVEMIRRGGRAPWDGGADWWGDAADLRAETSVVLRRVVVSSPQPSATVAFFETVLGGAPAGERRLRWGGGEVLVEAGTKAGIDRLEVAGMSGTMILGGTRFLGVD